MSTVEAKNLASNVSFWVQLFFVLFIHLAISVKLDIIHYRDRPVF